MMVMAGLETHFTHELTPCAVLPRIPLAHYESYGLLSPAIRPVATKAFAK
jgi:hypothetical protein